MRERGGYRDAIAHPRHHKNMASGLQGQYDHEREGKPLPKIRAVPATAKVCPFTVHSRNFPYEPTDFINTVDITYRGMQMPVSVK